jgi:hypothetical protein
MKKRFGVLRFIANFLKALGIVVAALGVLGGLALLIMSFAGGDMWSSLGYDANSGFLVGLLGSFGVFISGVLLP